MSLVASLASFGRGGNAIEQLQARLHLQCFPQPALIRERCHKPICGLARHGQNPSRRYSVKPRVVLLGWLGAEARHFEKYVQLWKDWGHDTVAIRPPTSAILFPPRGDACARQFAQSLLQAAAQSPRQPVIYHVFSNAGFLFLSTILRLAAQQAHTDQGGSRRMLNQSEQSVASAECANSDVEGSSAAARVGGMDAIIFDSAPAPLTPDMASRGLMAAILGQQAHGIEDRHPRLVATAAQPLDWLLRSSPIASRSTQKLQLWAAWGIGVTGADGSTCVGKAPGLYLLNEAIPYTGDVTPAGGGAPPRGPGTQGAGAPGSTPQLAQLAAAAPRCPQLALYSTADVLIPHASVEGFIYAQGQRGVRTSLHCWSDTAHCEHFRYHKDEYKEQLNSFLKSL